VENISIATDFYSTLAEVIIALAALAGLLAVFREPVISNYLITRLERFIRFSLIIMVGAFVPLIVARAATSDWSVVSSWLQTSEDIWTVCSLLYAIIVVGLMISERSLLTDPDNDEKRLTVTLYISSAIAVIGSLVNVFVWKQELVFMLGMSFAVFVVVRRFLVLLRIVLADPEPPNNTPVSE
jgi:hypothetical protein